MLALILGIAAAAGWIVFDVIASIVTYPAMSSGEWWTFVLSGAALVILTVVVQILEYRERQKDEQKHSEEHGTLASGMVMLAGMVQAGPNQTPGEITQAAIQKIGHLESTLSAYQSIFWAPLTDEQKSTLINHLKELGPRYVRVSNSDESDCIELARDLRECFEHAQWRLEKFPDSDRWGSAVANGLMFFRRNTESPALNSGVMRALAAAIPGSPVLLYQLQEGDDVDLAIIVGTRKLRQS